eukprot:8598439-Alexandrium_andersonii.AAC.1
MWVWLLGSARVEQVARAAPDAFMAIEAAVGLSAVAARQRPFRDWRLGRAVTGDGGQVPGTRASVSTAAVVGRVTHRLTPDTVQALDRWADSVRPLSEGGPQDTQRQAGPQAERGGTSGG